MPSHSLHRTHVKCEPHNLVPRSILTWEQDHWNHAPSQSVVIHVYDAYNTEIQSKYRVSFLPGNVIIIIWPFQQRCSRCSRYQLEWSSTESPAATLVICTIVWRPGEEQGGERRERGEREGEKRISEKGGRQSYGYYLRAPYVLLGDSDCAATCTIWGWCLFEELRY